MISVTSFFICGILGYLIYYFFNGRTRGKTLPGPWKLPLLGNLLSLGKLPHIKIGEWVEKYGKIFQIGFGPYKCVVLADPKMIRDAFNDLNLSGRVDLESFNLHAGGKHGVISSDGPEWVEQRRFTVRNLRDYGFGKNSMEFLIMEEVNEYLDFLKLNEGKSISVHQRFSLAVLNSLWMIIASHRYGHDDPRLLAHFEQHKKLSEDINNSPAIMIPSLAKLAPEFSGWNRVIRFLETVKDVARGHINHHKKTFVDGEPRDFIDVYLKEIYETKDPSSSFYKDVGDRSLNAVVQDLFFAGSDTTSATLSWLVLYLCKFPHTQLKLQEELDHVIGKNRRPTLADRPNLLYTELVIIEAMRLSSLTPIGVFHVAMTDVKFNGFDIPKGTWLMPALHYLNYSKDFWKEPESFIPERHLSKDGKGVFRHEALMPFSTGRRQCAGQSMALDSMFLFLTTIFQKFSLSLAEDSKNATLEPKIGFFLTPKDFNVVIKERY